MLSRVAETVYWMQRYRERAENTARLLEVNLYLSTDAPREMGNQWEPMIETMGGRELFDAKYKSVTEENVIEFMTFDRENPNSILNSLKQARENARSVRETIAGEMWDEINTAYLYIKRSAGSRMQASQAHALFSRIKRQCQLITGIADTCMAHDDAWYFGRLGNLIERADMTTRILDVKYFMLLRSPDDVGSPYDSIQWMALLKSASSLETYRKMWRLIHPEHVVAFMILNDEFPRAVMSCVKRIEQSLAYISRAEKGKDAGHPHSLSLKLVEEIWELSGPDIIERGIHEFIDAMQIKLNEIDEAIYRRYFSLQNAPVALHS